MIASVLYDATMDIIRFNSQIYNNKGEKIKKYEDNWIAKKVKIPLNWQMAKLSYEDKQRKKQKKDDLYIKVNLILPSYVPDNLNDEVEAIYKDLYDKEKLTCYYAFQKEFNFNIAKYLVNWISKISLIIDINNK